MSTKQYVDKWEMEKVSEGTTRINVSNKFLEDLANHAKSKNKTLKEYSPEQLISEFYHDKVKQPEPKQPEAKPVSEDVVFEDNEPEGADIGELFNADELEKKTDLTPRQILAFSRAKTFAEKYNSAILTDFLKNYGNYAISKNRKGRSEFVEAFKIKVLEPMGIGGVQKDEKE